jgi:hypothetical protein
MTDEEKSKEQLIRELKELRGKLSEPSERNSGRPAAAAKAYGFSREELLELAITDLREPPLCQADISISVLSQSAPGWSCMLWNGYPIDQIKRDEE